MRSRCSGTFATVLVLGDLLDKHRVPMGQRLYPVLVLGRGQRLLRHIQTWISSVETIHLLAHQNRTIAIASDFRVDGAKSQESSQKEGVLGSEIAARNRKSLATFHRNLKSQCSIAFSCLRDRCGFWGPRWASQSQIAKITAISVR